MLLKMLEWKYSFKFSIFWTCLSLGAKFWNLFGRHYLVVLIFKTEQIFMFVDLPNRYWKFPYGVIFIVQGYFILINKMWIFCVVHTGIRIYVIIFLCNTVFHICTSRKVVKDAFVIVQLLNIYFLNINFIFSTRLFST